MPTGNPGGPRSRRTHSGTSRQTRPLPRRTPGASGAGGGGTSGPSGCEMALPVAVLATLFYAMPRMAWADWRKRRG